MRWMLGLFLLVLVTAVPGLRKLPKVYNALITTDQNLLPSRAFPVLQPVIHKTTVGYVPPYYYSQFAPQFTPEYVQISQGVVPENSPQETIKKATNENESNNNNNNKKESDQIPLRFYPNYHSFYYDPYFYTYNGFDSHLAPTAYQDNGSVEPLPPQNLQNLQNFPQQLLPSHYDEKRMKNVYHEKKKDIPDVPPPPVPTKITKNS